MQQVAQYPIQYMRVIALLSSSFIDGRCFGPNISSELSLEYPLHFYYFFWDTDLTDLHGLKNRFPVSEAKSFHEFVFIHVLI